MKKKMKFKKQNDMKDEEWMIMELKDDQIYVKIVSILVSFKCILQHQRVNVYDWKVKETDRYSAITQYRCISYCNRYASIFRYTIELQFSHHVKNCRNIRLIDIYIYLQKIYKIIKY